jgi:hypothetical protein
MNETLETTLGFYHTEEYIILNGEKKESNSIFGLNTERDIYEEVYEYGTNEEYLTCINAMSNKDANRWVAYCLSAEEINERDYLLFQRFHHLINEDDLLIRLDSLIKWKVISDSQEYHTFFQEKYKLKSVFYNTDENSTPTDLDAHNHNELIKKQYWDFDSKNLAIEYKKEMLSRWNKFTGIVIPFYHNNTISLSSYDAEIFMKSLGNPPKINDKLLKASQNYKKVKT